MLERTSSRTPVSRQRSRAARSLAPVTLLRLMTELVSGALTLWLRFPRLRRDDRLHHIQRCAKRVLLILNIDIECDGAPPAACAGLVVANHVSWLDILVIQSLMPGVFVAKAEVRRWPLIGPMARACATIFVQRSSPRSTRAMVDRTAAALAQGYSVVGFPEGTSSDGAALGVFHTNLFEAAIMARTHVQTVTLRYVHAQTGAPAEAAQFTGNTTLLSSLRRVLASAPLRTQVYIGPCIASVGHTRKSLAHQAHLNMRGHLSRRPHGDASNA